MNKYILLLISVFLLAGCQSATQTGSTGKPKVTISSYEEDKTLTPTIMTTNTDDSFDQLAAPQKGDTVATLKTSMGIIKFKLFTSEAPEITKNFIELAKAGKYTNVKFHRVIKEFMIQTGDFERGNGTGGYSYQGPGTELADEISPKLLHHQYTVSMANHGRDTNGSQFFIVSAENGTPWLNGAHTIFGQVYEGTEVVDKIEAAKTAKGDVPLQEILIKEVSIETL